MDLEIIAHRGASHYCPENTLASFEKALSQGVDGIELDVRMAKDGELVISHDATVDRLSDTVGYIFKKNLKQLKKMDFGKKFSKKYKGEPIATFEEVLNLTADHDITLHIELKNDPNMPKDLEEKVLDAVASAGAESKAIYSSFDHQALEKIYKINPDTRLGLLFHINLIDPFAYIDRLNIPVYALHPNHIYVDKKYVKAAHKRDMRVNIYTVNQKAWAKDYQKMGVDGLITNDPLILK